MGAYIILTKVTPQGAKAVKARPDAVQGLAAEVAAVDGKVVGQYALLGEFDFCTIVSLPDNAAAHLLVGQGPVGAERTIFPAIDLPLFVRLLGQTTETVGPYPWQTRWWARLARPVLWWYDNGRKVKPVLKPFTVLGQEHLRGLKNPVIVIGNHSSHLDAAVMYLALPRRIRSKLAFAGAADRWFLKGVKGFRRQGWWQSLVYGSFPMKRGGGRAALAYAEWLIDQGWSIGIFPEGTRSASGKMGRFRAGPAILAVAKGVPVLPMYFEGLKDIRPKGAREMTPGPATAIIGAPIRFGPDTDIAEATHTLYKAVEALRQRVHRPHAARAPREEVPAPAGS